VSFITLPIRSISNAIPLSYLVSSGKAVIPLDILEEGQRQDLWVPIVGSSAKVHIAMKRVQKRVEDLDNDTLIEKMNTKLVYALKTVQVSLSLIKFLSIGETSDTNPITLQYKLGKLGVNCQVGVVISFVSIRH